MNVNNGWGMPATKAEEDSWLTRCGLPACRERMDALTGESVQGEQEQSEWPSGAWFGSQGNVKGQQSGSSVPVWSRSSHGPANDATVVSTTMAMPANIRIISQGRFMNLESPHYTELSFLAASSCLTLRLVTLLDGSNSSPMQPWGVIRWAAASRTDQSDRQSNRLQAGINGILFDVENVSEPVFLNAEDFEVATE